MERKERKKASYLSLILAGVMSVIISSGCEGLSKKVVGTATGATLGATTGYFVAGDEDRTEGAIIGGALGAGAGYLIGKELEKQEQKGYKR